MLNFSGPFCFLSWGHDIKRVAVSHLEQLPWMYHQGEEEIVVASGSDQGRNPSSTSTAHITSTGLVMDPATVLGARAKVEAKNISASGNGNRVGAVGV